MERGEDTKLQPLGIAYEISETVGLSFTYSRLYFIVLRIQSPFYLILDFRGRGQTLTIIRVFDHKR